MATYITSYSYRSVPETSGEETPLNPSDFAGAIDITPNFQSDRSTPSLLNHLPLDSGLSSASGYQRLGPPVAATGSPSSAIPRYFSHEYIPSPFIEDETIMADSLSSLGQSASMLRKRRKEYLAQPLPKSQLSQSITTDTESKSRSHSSSESRAPTTLPLFTGSAITDIISSFSTPTTIETRGLSYRWKNSIYTQNTINKAFRFHTISQKQPAYCQT
ncbi:unnamed protein product [Ambrosiozyma monospora]|uniref:Unnamed protein product n=1 Tax=Ambrosiozyma monospora TaxID=43982 RepID=A0ACB5SUY1_AMBMO|nr:unnamed protein product [Ambrosiozyma monospora]